MHDHTNENIRPIRRIPREKVEDKREYQRRHELSLLELLMQAHPERAKMIMDKLRDKIAA